MALRPSDVRALRRAAVVADAQKELVELMKRRSQGSLSSEFIGGAPVVLLAVGYAAVFVLIAMLSLSVVVTKGPVQLASQVEETVVKLTL